MATCGVVQSWATATQYLGRSLLPRRPPEADDLQMRERTPSRRAPDRPVRSRYARSQPRRRMKWRPDTLAGGAQRRRYRGLAGCTSRARPLTLGRASETVLLPLGTAQGQNGRPLQPPLGSGRPGSGRRSLNRQGLGLRADYRAESTGTPEAGRRMDVRGDQPLLVRQPTAAGLRTVSLPPRMTGSEQTHATTTSRAGRNFNATRGPWTIRSAEATCLHRAHWRHPNRPGSRRRRG